MIVNTRHINCNFCGEWASVDDDETAREARKRLARRGWRVLPNADQRGRLMDACPRHPAPAPIGSGAADHTSTDSGGEGL